MTNLIPFQTRFLVPQENSAVSLAYVIQPNEYDYMGEAAVALLKDAVWISYGNDQHEVIHYQNIRQTEVHDLRGISFEQEKYGKRTYISPRDAWAVTITHEERGNYRYTFTFMTFFADNAYEWKRKIEQALKVWDKTIPSQL